MADTYKRIREIATKYEATENDVEHMMMNYMPPSALSVKNQKVSVISTNIRAQIAERNRQLKALEFSNEKKARHTRLQSLQVTANETRAGSAQMNEKPAQGDTAMSNYK